MPERRKITVVGAGNVGATCAQVLASRDYADVVLVDIKEGLPQGKALDINQMGAVLGYEPNVVGSNGYDETEAADRLESAIAEVISEGTSVTYDMKPRRDDPTAVGTSEVADAIVDKLGAPVAL